MTPILDEDYLTNLGIAWPDRHPTTGEPFAELDGFSRTCSVQTVHHMPIGYPSREVAIEWETRWSDEGEWSEEYEVPTKWRTMADDEWANALAHYEKHKHETFGFVPAGQDHIEGTFETASGSWAKGVWTGKEWFWTESAAVYR